MTTIISGDTGIDKVQDGADMPAGCVLQVVNATYSTYTTRSSAAYADTGLTASITPRATTSKILVIVNQAGCGKSTNNTYLSLKLLRDATTIVAEFAGNAGANGGTATNITGTCSATYLDSPASVSALTYKTQFASVAGLADVLVQNNSSTSTITLMEIAG